MRLWALKWEVLAKIAEKTQIGDLPVKFFSPKFFSHLITYISTIPVNFNEMQRKCILAHLSGAPPNEKLDTYPYRSLNGVRLSVIAGA